MKVCSERINEKIYVSRGKEPRLIDKVPDVFERSKKRCICKSSVGVGLEAVIRREKRKSEYREVSKD